MSTALVGALAPRYKGSKSALEDLTTEIVDGCAGAASKGTTMQFDCTADEIKVSINGKTGGAVKGKGLGAAFVDIYADEKAASSLRENLKAMFDGK